MKFILNTFKYLKNPLKHHPHSLFQRIKDVWSVLMGGFSTKKSKNSPSYRFGISDWLTFGLSAFLRKGLKKLNQNNNLSFMLLMALVFSLLLFGLTNAIRYFIGALLFLITFPVTFTIQLTLWSYLLGKWLFSKDTESAHVDLPVQHNLKKDQKNNSHRKNFDINLPLHADLKKDQKEDPYFVPEKHQETMHPQLIARLGNTTSDHTLQLFKYEIDGVLLKGGTWNCLNKCQAMSENRPYSNNPFNYNETYPQYASRFSYQLEIIRSRIEKGSVDFLLLQEVMAFFFTGPRFENPRKEFEAFLENHGFQMQLIPSSKTQQAFVFIWNTNKLTLHEEKPCFPNKSQFNRAYSMTFQLKDSERKVEIINTHLDYRFDHSQQINDYKEESQHLVIIAGDTNAPPGERSGRSFQPLTQQKKHLNYATNIDAKEGSNFTEITHLDAGNSSKTKMYDNVTNNQNCKIPKKSYFFVPQSPNSNQYRVVREKLAAPSP